MKTIIILSSVALALASCTKQESTAANEPATSEAAAVKPYPLEVCTVSGEKLGSMGEPHVIVYEGQEIKFCCKHCEPDFRKDPEKYLSKLDKQ